MSLWRKVKFVQIYTENFKRFNRIKNEKAKNVDFRDQK